MVQAYIYNGTVMVHKMCPYHVFRLFSTNFLRYEPQNCINQKEHMYDFMRGTERKLQKYSLKGHILRLFLVRTTVQNSVLKTC